MIIHVAVIEWDSADGDPSVFLGHDAHTVAQRAARTLMNPDNEPPSDWPEVAQALPLTPEVLGDPEALQEWHATYREHVTVPWCTFYVEVVPDRAPAGA